MGGIFLTIFGSLLIVAMLATIIHYYSGKKKDKIEEPKYSMMKDEDDNLS